MTTALLAVAAAVLLAAALLFGSRKARLTAVLCLLPLGGLAWVLADLGQRPRPPATHIETNPTVFGDGSHEVGASHASGGPATDTPSPADAQDEVQAALGAARSAEGLGWPEPAASYTVNTLANRINGAAEHYKAYGLRGAVFATARVAGTDADVDLQVFDMGTAEAARKLWDATDRDPAAAALPGVGDEALLWQGGGELLHAALYIKVVLTGPGDDPRAVAAPEALLRAIATAPHPSAAPAESLEQMLQRARRSTGLEWPDPGKRYTSRTLWDRINGAAELYRRHGVRGTLIATARVPPDADIEVQLFDLGSASNAAALYAETTRGVEGTTAAIGDAALLWPGGGEARRGAVYARIVLSTASQASAVLEAPKALLEAMLGAGQPTPPASRPDLPAPGLSATTTEPPGPTTEPPAPTTEPVPPATVADSLGVAAHVIDHYGIQAADVTTEGALTVRVVTLRDPWAAAAWGRSLASGSEGSTVLVRGAVVVWADGPGADVRAARATEGLEAPALPGHAALAKRASEVDIRLGGWNGVAALGPTLVGSVPEEIELVVASPRDPTAALAALVARLESRSKPDARGVIAGSDAYQGDLLAARAGGHIVVVVGYEDAAAGRKLLEEVLADL